MPTTFSLTVDTVAVTPRAPLRRAHTSQCDEGLYTKSSSANMPAATGDAVPASGTEDLYAGMCGADGQPFAYPTPVCVRNTFVELVPGRDPSLDEFFEERKTHSCPASWGPSVTIKEEEQEEVPLASSRTTACGSADGDSAAASTPPQFSDAEDTIELTPRDDVGEGPCAAACMRRSCGFQRTLTDYRDVATNRSQPMASVDAHHASACASASPGHAVPQRAQPGRQQWEMPPGQFTQVPQDGMALSSASVHPNLAAASTGYAQSYTEGGYHLQFSGYDVGYDAGYANNYSSIICIDGYQNYAGQGDHFDAPSMNASGAGCMPPQFAPIRDRMDAHAAVSSHGLDRQCLAGDVQQQVVLQLSAAIHHHATPVPPPPGPPAPAGAALPLPPAPPSTSPEDSDDENVLIIPTRGSMNHGLGRCKPCAFVHTKGCGNGFDCPFCHLCAPGEKKKRRKEKLEARRTMRELRQAFAMGGPDFLRRGPLEG